MLLRRTGDPALDANTLALENAVDSVKALPIVGGRLMTGVTLAAGVATDVAHRLGRPWRGWLLCGMSGAAGAGYINETTTGYDTSNLLRLTATSFGATITVRLWIF